MPSLRSVAFDTLRFRISRSEIERLSQDKFDLGCNPDKNEGFLRAIVVMDKVGVWEEGEGEQENWVGAEFARPIDPHQSRDEIPSGSQLACVLELT